MHTLIVDPFYHERNETLPLDIVFDHINGDNYCPLLRSTAQETVTFVSLFQPLSGHPLGKDFKGIPSPNYYTLQPKEVDWGGLFDRALKDPVYTYCNKTYAPRLFDYCRGRITEAELTDKDHTVLRYLCRVALPEVIFVLGDHKVAFKITLAGEPFEKFKQFYDNVIADPLEKGALISLDIL